MAKPSCVLPSDVASCYQVSYLKKCLYMVIAQSKLMGEFYGRNEKIVTAHFENINTVPGNNSNCSLHWEYRSLLKCYSQLQ